MHNPAIRPAVCEDIETIRAIMDEAVRLLPSRDWYADDDIDYLKRHIRDEGYILVYMADRENEKPGTAAGFLLVRHPGSAPDNMGMYLDPAQEDRMEAVHLESSAVSAAFRGQGIMHALLSEAIMLEKENGQTRHMFATVHPDNHFSKSNMESVGFRSIRTLKKYGAWVRDIMYLPL